jgi:small subunit ribosomal protein S18
MRYPAPAATPRRRLCHPYRPMGRGNKNDRRRGKLSLKGEARRYSKLPREEIDKIDYKNIALLQRFVTERGKIRSRRVTGLSRRDQSKMARAVKRARELGLLPYVDASKAVERVGGGGRRRERE